MARPDSPLGLNQRRRQWLTVHRARRPKAVRSGSCRCPPQEDGAPALPRGIVGKDRLPRQHMPPAGVGQRRQQSGGFADPVGQCRAIQIETVAPEDLALAIQRQVIGVFVDQHMREQTRARTPALDRARWQPGLAEAIAAGASHPRPPRPAQPDKSWFCVRMHAGRFTISSHFPPLVRGQWRGPGHIFQFLGPFVGKTFHWKVF